MSDQKPLLRIKYSGPIYDPSGYAEFARSFIVALHKAGVPVQVEALSFDKARPDLGAMGELCKSLEKPLPPMPGARDLKIINVTPEHFERLCEPGFINLGFTMFETTRIPDTWVTDCNRLDGILVPCGWNREVFEQSGVTVPVRVVAPGIEVSEEVPSTFIAHRNPELPAWIQGATVLSDPRCDAGYTLADAMQAYRFYSVFQWTERKNPIGLLKAYFSEFHADEGVCLILKTYRSNVSKLQQMLIRMRIRLLKRSMRLKRFPPVVLVGGLLSRKQLRQLHADCDCFVLPHRAEGFGMPHLEAMSYGRPVITTGFSGNMEFNTPENSRLLPYQLTPVSGMHWLRWYEGDMMWAEPDLGALRQELRQMFQSPAAGSKLGSDAQRYVQQHFNWPERVKQMMQTLAELVNQHDQEVSHLPISRHQSVA